jgi:REP-associated tyrosine transposase
VPSQARSMRSQEGGKKPEKNRTDNGRAGPCSCHDYENSTEASNVRFRDWGGKRRGAGRKPKGEVALVSHAKRARLCPRHPVHVTVKLRTGLPSLRRKENHRALLDAFGAATGRFGMGVVHYSVQSNHVHLLVEAEDGRSLSRGMQGLCVRIARSLNRLWKRRGKVFADRYHAHVLQTPREVRNALRYLFHNTAHHGVRFLDGFDPFTSAEHFDGWKSPRRLSAESTSSALREVGFLARARTWLLSVGWRRHGLLPCA